MHFFREPTLSNTNGPRHIFIWADTIVGTHRLSVDQQGIPVLCSPVGHNDVEESRIAALTDAKCKPHGSPNDVTPQLCTPTIAVLPCNVMLRVFMMSVVSSSTVETMSLVLPLWWVHPRSSDAVARRSVGASRESPRVSPRTQLFKRHGDGGVPICRFRRQVFSHWLQGRSSSQSWVITEVARRA